MKNNIDENIAQQVLTIFPKDTINGYIFEPINPKYVPSAIFESNNREINAEIVLWINRFIDCKVTLKRVTAISEIFNFVFGYSLDKFLSDRPYICLSGEISSIYDIRNAGTYMSPLLDYDYCSEFYVKNNVPAIASSLPENVPEQDFSCLLINSPLVTPYFKPVNDMPDGALIFKAERRDIDNRLMWNREVLVKEEKKQLAVKKAIPKVIEGNLIKFPSMKNITEIHITDEDYNINGQKSNWISYLSERKSFLDANQGSGLTELVAEWETKFGSNYVGDMLWLILNQLNICLSTGDAAVDSYCSVYEIFTFDKSEFFYPYQYAIQCNFSITSAVSTETYVKYVVNVWYYCAFGDDGGEDFPIFSNTYFNLEIRKDIISGELTFASLIDSNIDNNFSNHRININSSLLPSADFNVTSYERFQYNTNVGVISQELQTYLDDRNPENSSIGYNFIATFDNPANVKPALLPAEWLRKKVFPYKNTNIPEAVFYLWESLEGDDIPVRKFVNTKFKGMCTDVTLAPKGSDFIFVGIWMKPGTYLRVGDEIEVSRFLNEGSVYPQQDKIANIKNATILWNIVNDSAISKVFYCLVALKKQKALDIASAYDVLNPGETGRIVYRESKFVLEGVN
jgi:hypothetical protein